MNAAEIGAQPRADSLIRLRNLSVGYNGRAVLAAVDLEVRAGEFWFLVGPNGVGKTTLLHTILGRLRPIAGSVQLDPAVENRSAVGFVPQRCDLNPTLPTTVREFVSLGLVGTPAARIGRGSERARNLVWALQHVGLGGMERKDYWSLSGGQRQRALVARALVRRPRLLIADEPTAGLDIAGTLALLDALVDLHVIERLTVLFVTQHLTLAAGHGTHCALSSGGGLIAGDIAGVLSAENLENAYGVPFRVTWEPSGALNVQAEPGRIAGGTP